MTVAARTIGDVFGDAWSVVEDLVSSGADSIRSLPGFQDASDALVDFARTPTGMAVFRAMSTALYTPLAWSLGFSIGPQLASVVFALPGLLKGDDFDEAWFTEVAWRSEQAAEVLAPELASQYGDELADALVKIAEENPDITEGLHAIAERLNITREDIAYLAMQKIKGELELIVPPPIFDPATGKQITTSSTIATSLRVTPWMIEENPMADSFRLNAWMVAPEAAESAVNHLAYATPPTAPKPAPRRVPIKAGGTSSSKPSTALYVVGALLVLGGGYVAWKKFGKQRNPRRRRRARRR